MLHCRKKKKDKVIRQSVRQEKLGEKLQMTQKLTETRRREIEAEQLYEKWLENKVSSNSIKVINHRVIILFHLVCMISAFCGCKNCSIREHLHFYNLQVPGFESFNISIEKVGDLISLAF